MGAITPINIVSDLLQGVHQLKTSRKDRQIVSDSDRKLTDITPGYLNVKIFDSGSSCSVNADDTASTEGLWVEVGIPIGICIAVPPFSIKIGYDMVPTTVAGINTSSYAFFVEEYIFTSCSGPSTTQTLPSNDEVPLPEACVNYTTFVDEYYPNRTAGSSTMLGYNVDMSLSTTFSSVQDPWGDLPMGEFSFLFTSSSSCNAASASTNPITGKGAFYNWIIANTCVDGAIATCGGTNAGNTMTVAAYADPECTGNISTSDTFSEVICGSYDATDGSGTSSEIQEIFELFGIEVPTIDDDNGLVAKYVEELSGTTYCGNQDALTQPTLQPTSDGHAASGGSMTSAEVTETVVGSLFGVGLLVFVLFVAIFHRERAIALLCGKETDGHAGQWAPKDGYSQYNDEGSVQGTASAMHTATYGIDKSASSGGDSSSVGAVSVGARSVRPMADQSEL